MDKYVKEERKKERERKEEAATLKEMSNIKENPALKELEEPFNDADFVTVADDNKVENPFVELRNLITSKNIEVKTILTPRQVTINHKLRTVSEQLRSSVAVLKRSGISKERIDNINLVSQMIHNFSYDWLTLIINKDGTSRKQFIEALHKGAEKAEEAKNAALQSRTLAL